MSKIVKAVNVMVAHPEWISSVIIGASGREYFFIYKNGYKWSIAELMDTSGKKSYTLFYYPGKQKIEDLAGMEDYEWSDFSQMIKYNSDAIGGREVAQSFKELYTLVQEKAFGMDEVLDDIVRDDM